METDLYTEKLFCAALLNFGMNFKGE